MGEDTYLFLQKHT